MRKERNFVVLCARQRTDNGIFQRIFVKPLIAFGMVRNREYICVGQTKNILTAELQCKKYGKENVIASDISISGSYYFSRYSQTWGWATWKRTWKLYDIHMKRWPEMKGKHMVEKMFPNIWTRTYWTWIFNAVYRGEIPSAWDYQWTFMSWLHGLLTIMPTVNMIQNTGIGSKDATHTKYTNWMSSIPVKPMTFPLKHPKGKIINSALDTLLQRRMYVLWKELVMSIYRKLKYTV